MENETQKTPSNAIESSTLLACPFCGSDAKQAIEHGWNLIYCSNNDCLVEPCTHDFETPDEAVTAWNKRAS